ncbi:MAG: hypothetical protein WAV13_01540 [Thermodesulfovibrionales bacterium]
MKKIIIAILFLMSFAIQATVAAPILAGKYFTTTESECNMELILYKNGHGKAIQTCRLEDGSHRDEKKENKIIWKQNNNKITITALNQKVDFIYKEAVSCEEFGSKGHSTALVLETKGDHIFNGYNSSFWKSPRNCK